MAFYGGVTARQTRSYKQRLNHCKGNVKFAVYFAPNTDRAFLDAVNVVVHDNHNKPTALLISWGGSEDVEDGSTLQFKQAVDRAFQQAVAASITAFISAGDDGSEDRPRLIAGTCAEQG
jgi:subtilase family serine protease